MAVPTGTVQTFAMVGIREELSDVITNISPMDVPFYSMCKKGKTKSRSPEWQQDSLADADGDNAVVEGYDVTADAAVATVRLKNYVQLMDKVVSVSTTAQSVESAGRSNELKYQVAKKGKELKRDIEKRITGNYASVVGNTSTAGKCAGAEAWIETNVSTVGAVGGYDTGTGLVDAATDSTQRAITEAMLKEVVREAWASGGEPTMVMVGPFNKQAISGFTGIATQYRENSGMKQASILGAADVYISDFGELRVVANRFSRDRTALVLQPDTWEIKFLQPFSTTPLAKTGHNDKRMLATEFTLANSDEASNGKIADLTTS
jgi:hypothetical protein